jgi:hypothetical protein
MRVHREVIKHSAAVQIQSRITLLQRRAWNELLFHAYNELPNEERHHIDLATLMARLEYHSKDESYLQEILERLVTCEVKWNLLGKDDQWEWGVTTLLAEAKIRNGTLTYAYGPELRERLHNPRMYARLNLDMQNKFESKYAESLWEHCVDYFDIRRSEGETPFIELDTYREMMGVEEGMYPQFKRLNELVIKKPVKEINKVTNFQVTVDYKKSGRKVQALKFKVKLEQTLPGLEGGQLSLLPEIDDIPQVVRELKYAGLNVDDAWEIHERRWGYVDEARRPDKGNDWEAAFDLYIREKIHLLNTRKKSGKLSSSTGFLIKAIKENYANPEFAEEERRLLRRRKPKQREALEDEKSRILWERDEHKRPICAELLTPELADELLTELAEQDANIKFWLNRELTALENYQDGGSLAAMMDMALEKRYPDRFQAINDEYQPRLDAMDVQIAALE